MKRLFLLSALVILAGFIPEARAQNPSIPVTTLTAAASTCTAGVCLSVALPPGIGAASFTINANAGGNTIQFEASGDGGSTWVALSVTPSNSTTTVTSTTGSGVWRASVAGYTNVRMRMSTQSSGNTLVNIYPSTASALGLGGAAGSGTGTVTSIATTSPITGGTITTTGTIACATCVAASSPGVGLAHFAGSTQTVTSSTVATADIAANAVTSAKLAVVNTRRVCDIAVGDTSGSAITNSQLGPQKRICYVPAAATIVEMDVAADAGTPNVIVAVNHAGTPANIVSGALATASSGGIACSNTGGTTGIDGATTCSNTLQNTSIAAGDYLELVSGTAGGTAKLFTAHIIYTIN